VAYHELSADNFLLYHEDMDLRLVGGEHSVNIWVGVCRWDIEIPFSRLDDDHHGFVLALSNFDVS